MFGMGTGVTPPPWPPANKRVTGKIAGGTSEGVSPDAAGIFLFNAPANRRGEKKGGQASRLISTGKLKPLLTLHLRPIDPVVFRESLECSRHWETYSSGWLGA